MNMRLPFVLLLAIAGSSCSGVSDHSAAKTKDTSMPSTPSTPNTSKPTSTSSPAATTSLYAIPVASLDGAKADLSQYKGQVVLVVNTASECGFAPQYEGLEKLYEGRKAKGLVVLGFPSNDFGGQEPGDAAQIKEFCTSKFGVTFPMFSKVVTKSGADQSPVYAYLGSATGNLPTWNFCKYLVGKDGKVIAFFPSKVTPESKDLKDAIETALAK